MLKRFSEEELLRKPLAEEQKQELLALMDMGDENIDTSDIPEITEVPTHAARGEATRRDMVRPRRPDGKLPMPVYLNAELEDYLAAIALRRGVPLNDLVNDLLAQEIAIFEAVK